MEAITNVIKCKFCKSLIESPIVLPCGISICKKHELDSRNENTLLCVACEMDHPIPENGFYPNHALQAMIDTRIIELDLGTEYNQALKSCKTLESTIGDIELLKLDPHFYIHEAIHKIKQKIDVKRDELKHRIDQEADKLITNLEDYETICKMNMNSSIKNQHQIHIDLEQSKLELQKWKNELSILKTDKEKWQSIVEKSKQLDQHLKDNLDKIRQLLMMNRFEEYNLMQLEFDKIEIFIPYHDQKLDSNILNYELKLKLINLCQFPIDQKWKLLYRGSEDGFGAQDFHSKCDNKPNTLTIIKSTNGYIFGGYTDAKWDQSFQYKEDKNAFLFSLVNKEKMPVKMKIFKGREKYAIVSNGGVLLGFGHFNGNGHDLFISDNSNIKAESYSCLGSCYQHPSYNYKSEAANSFLAGSKVFKVQDIEIFGKLFDIDIEKC